MGQITSLFSLTRFCYHDSAVGVPSGDTLSCRQGSEGATPSTSTVFVIHRVALDKKNHHAVYLYLTTTQGYFRKVESSKFREQSRDFQFLSLIILLY